MSIRPANFVGGGGGGGEGGERPPLSLSFEVWEENALRDKHFLAGLSVTVLGTVVVAPLALFSGEALTVVL